MCVSVKQHWKKDTTEAIAGALYIHKENRLTCVTKTKHSRMLCSGKTSPGIETGLVATCWVEKEVLGIMTSVCTQSRNSSHLKITIGAVHRWLMLVSLATWEAEIRRIEAWGQPGQIVCETPLHL
jgi:hypothetical protein